jgi:mRNA-degrading endonuclease toxin of MazEF toxin-antitoxin module
MPVTLRQVVRSSSATAEAGVRAVSQAAVSSNAIVNRDACRAHGSATVVGPCSTQFTRGTAASR